MRDVLCNPKYTGHMVYNRRKNPRRDRGVPGKVNAPGEWIWSSKPTHEPLTTRTQFLAGTPIGKSNRGSRTSDRPNRHPATTRTYRLRSYVICDLCGRRLYGKTRRVGDGYSYYACEPVPAHHAGKPWYPTHPKSLWVREDKLLDAVRGFFTRRIFGLNRGALLLAVPDEQPEADDGMAARVAALRAKIKELERQQANVVKELREYTPIGDEDIDQQWRDQLRGSFAEITTQRKDLEAQLAGITAKPTAPTPSDPALLDRLPVVHADLGGLPEDLERELFDGFQLQVRYHQPTRRVTLRVTIDGRAVHRLASTSRAIMDRAPARSTATNTKRPPAAAAARGSEVLSLAVSAPNPSAYEPSTGD